MTVTVASLQQYLTDHKFYNGEISGNFGPRTKLALQTALSAGPDTPLTAEDIARAALAIGCDVGAIKAVCAVEAAGAGFISGLPKILFEGHLFSKYTGHQYDASHPAISYPVWDKSKYPATQAGRYQQLMDAVSLNPDAAFQSASYGMFQIIGANYAACKYADPLQFVMAMCLTEGAQLVAFVNFVNARGLAPALRKHDWAAFAKGYNGTAYRQNQYDTKLAAAYAKAK